MHNTYSITVASFVAYDQCELWEIEAVAACGWIQVIEMLTCILNGVVSCWQSHSVICEFISKTQDKTLTNTYYTSRGVLEFSATL